MLVVLAAITTIGQALPRQAVKLERRYPAHCPGQKFATTAFDPQIEWVSESKYRLHLKLTIQVCHPEKQKWVQYLSQSNDELAELILHHPWTEKDPQVAITIGRASSIDLSGISTQELQRWITSIYQPANIDLGQRPKTWNRPTALRWLNHLLDGQDFEQTLANDETLALHLVTFDFDLSQILTARDREKLSRLENGVVKSGEVVFKFRSSVQISYGLTLYIDRWGQMRVHHLLPL